jgi:SNF2 family DNA or RNA helicase
LMLEVMNNPSKRYLIFSEFNGTFEVIKKRFDQLQITYAMLYGSTSHIQKTIEQYKGGEINVLLLNALHFGAGLNLQMTDEIIIYHRMNSDLEKQVIGRAQRLGRESPLVIRYLCYSNEMPNESMAQNSEPINNDEDEDVIVIE